MRRFELEHVQTARKATQTAVFQVYKKALQEEEHSHVLKVAGSNLLAFLHYDDAQDVVFCYTCVKALPRDYLDPKKNFTYRFYQK